VTVTEMETGFCKKLEAPPTADADPAGARRPCFPALPASPGQPGKEKII